MILDDLAAACVHLLEAYDDPAPINVGTGEDVTIAELASAVARTVGFSGEIVYDTSRPDGTPRKVLDVSRIAGRALSGAPLDRRCGVRARRGDDTRARDVLFLHAVLLRDAAAAGEYTWCPPSGGLDRCADGAATEQLDSVLIRPKKADIDVTLVTLAFAPHWQDAGGALTAAF